MILFLTTSPNDDDLARALGSSAIRAQVPSDVCFWGVGESGSPLSIAAERKKIGDLAQCINDGRLLYQLQTAREEGIDVFCLVVEGAVRSNPEDGLLEIPVWGINPKTLRRAELWRPVKPTMTYSRFDQFLTELDWLAGVIVKRSSDVQETASIVKALWDNFQQPPGEHNSLHKIFEPPMGYVPLVRPCLVQRVAKELRGVGWGKSREVSGRFRFVSEMVSADEKDWQSIPGIGKKLARSIVSELKGS